MMDWNRELARKGHRVVLYGQPIAMHCHHYNINLQKTLEETLGDEGIRLIYRSVENTVYHSLKQLLKHYKKLKTLKSKLEMASILYQNSGLGIIHFLDAKSNGGRINSLASHHVTGWLAKHGRRNTPGCHFARGWIAGVLEAIFDHPIGYFSVDEIECKMMRNDECVFDVKVDGA
ncbi:MAG: hypothetical protein GY797_29760 [Deltaproteobacteria bacterium]|nr:hypothetical protein [Deltaproteobacteria bacterium]